MTIFSLGEDHPAVYEAAYVADSATVIGKVRLGRDASIWPQAMVRADHARTLRKDAAGAIL